MPQGSDRHDAAALRRRAIRLAVLIIVWDVVEGAVAVTAGIASGSIALLGFGIDSSIEVLAASVVLWQLRSGALRLTEQHIVMVGPDAIGENDHGHVEALLDDGLLLPNRLVFTPGNEETAAVLHHHVERKALQAVADQMAIETGRAARRRL